MAAANKRRFTEQMLERLRPPTSGRIELGDEIVPGLVLRVTPSGVKSFSVIYKVPGEGGVSATGGPAHRRQPLDPPQAADLRRLRDPLPARW